MKEIFKSIFLFLKKKFWYITLLCAGSVYIIVTRNIALQFSVIDAKNIIFVLWLILLIFPLFSELEFLGVKIKKEVEKSTSNIKEDIHDLELEIAQLQVTNNVSNSINLQNPLPSEEKIDKILAFIEKDQNIEVANNSSPIYDTNDKSVFLFKVRLHIEQLLRELCEKINKPVPVPGITKMLPILLKEELLDSVTCEMIRQVIYIANRGVHGEVVSDEYIRFVEKAYPEIDKKLKEVLSKELIYWQSF